MELFIQLIVAHLIADWIFQNDWIARYKPNPTHPAFYIHGIIHFIVMGMITEQVMFPLIIVSIHMLIDTRIPLKWWMRLYRHTQQGEYAIHVQIWLDQVFHIVSIYFILRLGGTI